MVKKLWKILSPFHKTFGWFVVLLIVYEALQIVDSYVITLVIRLFGEGVTKYVWVTLIIGLLAYDEMFTRLDNAIDWHIVVKQLYPVYRHLKETVLAKFMELDMSWHQDKNSGALVGKVNNGVERVQEIIEGLSWEFVPTLIQMLLSLIPLIFLSPLVAVVSLVSLIVFLKMTIQSNSKRQPLRKRRHDFYEDEWHTGIEAVQSVETLTMFGQERNTLDKYSRIHENIVNLGTQEMKIANQYNRWRLRLLTLSRRTILVIWVFQLYQGTLDIASLVFVSVLSERLFHSFWRFARLFDRASEASEGAERLVNLAGESTNLKDPGGRVISESPVGIEMVGVCFSYKGGYSYEKGAIHSLDLSIPGGSIIALVGPSGAGKTTIRKIVTRLIDIQEGQIFVAGVEVRKWPLGPLRELFSYVPQGDDVFIYSGSVRENIALPNNKASLAEIRRAAELAGIDSFITESLSEGYDTLLGERGKKLSGGQKQRVALARAILADRQVLILDEATSAVDAITEKEIQSKMRSILSGKTAIIVAHRLSTVWNLADKIVVLDKGSKVEEGTHTELMKANGLYATMVRLQTHSIE